MGPSLCYATGIPSRSTSGGRLDVLVSPEELRRRSSAWVPVVKEVPAGSYLERYSRMVTSAMEGAVFQR